MVGYSFDKPFSVFPAVIMRSEFAIIGSRACRPKELQEVIDLVATQKIKPFVSETFPLEQVNKVHDRLKKNEILVSIIVYIGNLKRNDLLAYRPREELS